MQEVEPVMVVDLFPQESYACQLTDVPTGGQRFLSENQRCYQRHHSNIHDTKRKEDHKQEPAATEAVGAMRHLHVRFLDCLQRRRF